MVSNLFEFTAQGMEGSGISFATQVGIADILLGASRSDCQQYKPENRTGYSLRVIHIFRVS
jgi:hypothetical protein